MGDKTGAAQTVPMDDQVSQMRRKLRSWKPSEICAICLGTMNDREGNALFTAECTHTFHFDCISTNVSHGNRTCPTCRATWNHLPFQAPPINAPPINAPTVTPLPTVAPNPPEFSDDEPISNNSFISNTDLGTPGRMILTALPHFAALISSDSVNSFPVLIKVRAPDLAPGAADQPDRRAPLDLVAVLDVSGSMNGQKLGLLKQAMDFVVENLTSRDRLSIVCFSTNARRVTPLCKMTDQAKTRSISAINSLCTEDMTNIIDGLRVGIRILEERRQMNPVSSIILLSDGQDNTNGWAPGFSNALQGLNVPASVPVHTFGFGSDHDAAALHAVSEVSSGGTFSFVESVPTIKEAFAQCIGGLLSVVCQDVKLTIQSACPGVVKIESISSGRYPNKLDQLSGLSGLIEVGEMYADEFKEHLVYLSIPRIEAGDASSSSSATPDIRTQILLNVSCTYTNPLTKEIVASRTEIVEVRRVEVLPPEDRQVNIEVEQQRNRVIVTDSIAKAKALAEKRDYTAARTLLDQERESLMATFSKHPNNAVFIMLECELREASSRMSNRAVYETDGRGYVLAELSARMTQRAVFQAGTRRRRMPTGGGMAPRVQLATRGCSRHITPAMERMVAKAKGKKKGSTKKKQKSKSIGVKKVSNEKKQQSKSKAGDNNPNKKLQQSNLERTITTRSMSGGAVHSYSTRASKKAKTG